MNPNAKEFQPRASKNLQGGQNPSNQTIQSNQNVKGDSNSAPKRAPHNQNPPKARKESSVHAERGPSGSFNPASRPQRKPRTSSGDSKDSHHRSDHEGPQQPANQEEVLSSSTAHSSKKGKSMNHLLNFTFPDRPKPTSHVPRKTVRRQPYDKQRYTHANFRFLVADTEEYLGHLRDPDAVVEWESVEQVIISNPQEQTCPICLSPPQAPRITKCGHVFCFSCILHYLALGEKSWRRCPICYDALHMKDLRNAKIKKVVPYSEGDVIRLTLMQKPKNSYIAYPRATWDPSFLSSFPLSENHSEASFSKLVIATPSELEQISLEDKMILEEQLLEAQSSGEAESLPFIEQALSVTEEKLKMIRTSPNRGLRETMKTLTLASKAKSEKGPAEKPEDPTSSSSAIPLLTSPLLSAAQDRSLSSVPALDLGEGFEDESHSVGDEEERWETWEPSSFEEEEPEKWKAMMNCKDEAPLPAKKEQDQRPKQTLQANEGGAELKGAPEILYFYQAEDGQPIFSHPLIARILLSDRGSPQNLPNEIEGKILEIEEISQSYETRKRFKTTAHLPLTSEFSFCEIELKPGPLITHETYKNFQAEIRQREQKRKSKALKEAKEKKKKEKNDLNNFERYQRFLESYSESFPTLEDRSLSSESFLDDLQNPPLPSPSSSFDTLSSSPSSSPFPPSSASSSASSAAGTSPKKGNYAGALKGPSGSPFERSIFSEADFAPTLSSAAPRKREEALPPHKKSAWGGNLPNSSPPFPSSFPSLGAAAHPPSAGPPTNPAPNGSSNQPLSFAKMASAPKPSPPAPVEKEEEGHGGAAAAGGGGKKGKKKTVLVISGSSLRKYS